jgi:ABC-2 type transport system ATP-binding protein
MIMSILFADSGTINVLGHGSALSAKDRIGYLPEERGSYRKMTVGAFLTYMGCLKGRTRAQASGRADRLLGRLGLPDVSAKKCEDLSKGMLQRVQFVAAIVNEPDLLILDEPFGGLDPLSVRLLREVIAEEHQRGATIIFSTHVMAHAEELCEQIVMIHKGCKVLDEPIAGLRRQYDSRTILLEPLDPKADLMALRSLPGVERVRLTDDGCEIGLAAGTEPGGAIRSVASLVAPARIELARIRLEDVFVRLVSGSAGSEESREALRTHLQGLSGEGAAA